MLLLKNGAKLDKRQKRKKKTGVTTKQKEKIDALSPPPLVCIKVTKRKKSAFNSFWIRSLFFCHIPRFRTNGPVADRARLRRETGTDLIKFPAVGGIFPGVTLSICCKASDAVPSSLNSKT